MAEALKRRALIVAGVGAVLLAYAAPWRSLWPERLEYFDIASLPPFRRLETGAQVSTGPLASPALIGLDAASSESGDEVALVAAMRAEPCAFLFPGWDGAGVPIAYFSDFRCPWCRALEADLAVVLAGRDVALFHHELPLFGPPSEVAARASIAAARQGGQDRLRERLLRARAVTDRAYVASVAGTLGLDPARLLDDMDEPKTGATLARTRAAARVLGLIGTPGLVIGRTVISGAVPAETLAQVLDDEAASLPGVCG
jgi:2-hydroxychromene-2-carboxylate isomerase